MSNAAQIILNKSDIDPNRLVSIVTGALNGYDGELYLESSQSTSLSLSNDRIEPQYNSKETGFGLRLLSGEQSAYAYSDDLTTASVLRAVNKIAEAKRGYKSDVIALPSNAPSVSSLYTQDDILLSMPSKDEQIKFFEDIERRLKAADPRIVQVGAGLSASMRHVHIIRADGMMMSDSRPMSSFNISAVGQQGDRLENAHAAFSMQMESRAVFNQAAADRLIEKVLHSLNNSFEAVDAKGGVMPVVIGNSGGGVVLHEAVGHGLEGDFNRKGGSKFSGLVGTKVAADTVTIIDDGTIQNWRGSVNIDDEGTAGGRNVLIENGILKGYMQDRQNATLMNVAPTGNGRRESFKHLPIPRMTNTFIAAGQNTPEEVIGSVQHGVYVTDFGGGQVDIVNGNFEFNATQAFRIRDGKVAEPIRGVSLRGNGPDAMRRVVMIGSDCHVDDSHWTCGKGGQGASVSVGQPTIRIDGLTVGGMG